ncbi:hypothetical protein [Streptomyces sp. NPDC088794]|uniref:hypothetical protein n=1 Tax=Streptomyces sp. NPDC088794 TaxID=3365902 RepID=UPI003817E85A
MPKAFKIMVAAALIVGTVGGLVALGTHARNPAYLIPMTPFALLILYGALVSLFQKPPKDQLRSETRARVREAERELEDALRGRAVPISGDSSGDTDEDAEGVPEAQVKKVPEDEQSRLRLAVLWEVTHRRLDLYHEIAQDQATQSFRNAQIAMGLGFTLLVGFVAIALNASTTAGSVVAGGLGAVSAALTGYISRTFIRSQEAAAGHLRAYFDQPLEFSRYLAVERLLTDARLTDQQRADALSLLVQAMIAGPAAQVPAGLSEEQPGNAP